MEDLSYLTRGYDDKIQKVLDLDAPLNFVFITDQHNEFRHPTDVAARSIQYILDRCPNISCVVSG